MNNIENTENLKSNYNIVKKEEKDNDDYSKRIDEINNFVINYTVFNKYPDILDIGPGRNPFIFANYIIDYSTEYKIMNEHLKVYNNLDIDKNKLPFENKSIDFVYSRYLLQEIQNPDYLMDEIIRVSNSGYIETPSPLIEITKGVDNSINSNISNLFAGYIHHRYIVWSDNEKCEIYFLPKYNSILDKIMTLNIDRNLYNNKFYRNNYFLWKNKTPNVIMYKKGINFGFINFIEEYLALVLEAVKKSIENTDKFLITNKVNKFIY